MTTKTVRVKWAEGMHLRPASRLVRLARAFRSSIRLRFGNQTANARSILSIMLLSASLGVGSVLEIETSGLDEQDAAVAIENFFADQDSIQDRG